MKTFVFIGTSLDGYIAKKNGDLNWLVAFQNDEVVANYQKFIKEIDAIVIGRGTYESVLKYPTWPYDRSVFVLSNSLTLLPETLRGKATLCSKSPEEVLKQMSGEGFSNIYVDGGKVIQSFLREDRIDEVIITRVPVLIGEGIPLFGSLTKDLAFEHKETNVLSNGLVTSRYVRVRGGLRDAQERSLQEAPDEDR